MKPAPPVTSIRIRSPALCPSCSCPGIVTANRSGARARGLAPGRRVPVGRFVVFGARVRALALPPPAPPAPPPAPAAGVRLLDAAVDGGERRQQKEEQRVRGRVQREVEEAVDERAHAA